MEGRATPNSSFRRTLVRLKLREPPLGRRRTHGFQTNACAVEACRSGLYRILSTGFRRTLVRLKQRLEPGRR